MAESKTFLARLEKLENIMRPKNSLAAKLKILAQEDRTQYERWKKAFTAWTEVRPNGKAYEDLLRVIAGEQVVEPPPELPGYIEEQISIVAPSFTLDDSEKTTQQKYLDFLEQIK